MPTHQLRNFHLYLHQPTVVMKARVNLPAGATYPITTIPFDTVSVGAYTDVAADSFFVIGSADLLDDRGRGRVQNVLSATNLPVGRLSRGTHDGEIDVYDNDYITFYNDFRVHAKIPYDAPSGIDYKDSDILVGDYLTTDMPPVANCGAGFADYIDSVTSLITVAFDGTGSYAMADGATIASYAWNLQGGTVTVGTLSSSTLTATFPAGFRWVSLTVTDSNGTPHSARCPVLAVNPASDVTIPFQVPSHRIEKMGQTIAFRLLDDRLRTTYPDGCLVMFWVDEPVSPSDRTHMWFIGWHQSDSFSIRATPMGLIRDTVLNCVDVAGRLAALPSFPQALQREAEDDVDIMWSLMPGLTLRRCLHYLAFWHSTALSLADFFLTVDLDDYPSMRLDSSGGNLYEQINSRAQTAVPDYWLTCDRQGNLHVLPDWMLLDVADRPSSPAGTLTEEYWNDIRVDYTRPPRVYVLISGAVVCSTEWIYIGGIKTLPLAFCDAPGTAFGQGVSESTTSEKLTISQAALNACEGHRYARLNARYGLFSIIEPSGDIDTYQPARMNYVALNISAEKAAQRGLDFTTARGLVKLIDMRYTDTDHGTWISPTIQWEKEVIGLPAVTHIPDIPEVPDFETPPPTLPTVPPDFGLIEGQQMVAGIGIDGYVYRTSDFQTVSGSGGPTWTRVDTTIADTIYSFVVDPFSPGYVPGATTGAINGWIVNDTAIYRVTDLFGTVVATSVFTFPTATSGASYHWRSIQASFGAFFAEGANPLLVCVSYYRDTAGHTGTWATRSTDGGVTWSAEVQITAHYNTTTPTRFSPIAVFTSPRTPGLVKTTAFTSTIADALAQGYKSTDWGATWTPDTVIQSGNAMAGSIHTPWEGNLAENVLYHGMLTEEVVEGTPEELMPHWGLVLESALSETVEGPSISKHTEITATDTGATPITEGQFRFVMAPPADAKRVRIEVAWSALRTRTNNNSGGTITHSKSDGSGTNETGTDFDYAQPAYGVAASGSYFVEWTDSGGGDWGRNREQLVTYASGDYVHYAHLNLKATASSISPSSTGFASITVSATVTEIELDDLTIYVPTLPSGARSFRLKNIINGLVFDISPTDGTILYGVQRFGFAIRAYDSNRQYVVAAVIGNDISGDPASDKHAVYISSNYGSTWTQVVAPIADSGAPAGRPAFEAAFGGDSEQILFIWGPGAYISYSSNFGVAVDSRSGNLAALGLTTGLVGIAGGPTP